MNNIKFSLNVARARRPALSKRPEQDPKYDHTTEVYDNLKWLTSDKMWLDSNWTWLKVSESDYERDFIGLKVPKMTEMPTRYYKNWKGLKWLGDDQNMPNYDFFSPLRDFLRRCAPHDSVKD